MGLRHDIHVGSQEKGPNILPYFISLFIYLFIYFHPVCPLTNSSSAISNRIMSIAIL